MPLEGSHLGRFRLLRLLGRGGMGEVYLAEDEQLRRHVAIKVIQTEDADPDATRLFEREARAIARLNHPHILPLFDFGEATIQEVTLTYMVMPFCHEGTLAAWMHQHRKTNLPSAQEVGVLIQQAASALQYAHNQHIVHQDVKPSNFLIRKSEEARDLPDLLLADFGVAKSMSATASVSQSVRGTPTYMAPEQWEATPVPATDQYALAIVAYELLTGHPPFQGSFGQVMYQHLHVVPPPPGTRNPRLPTDLDAVLLHALAKKPEERFTSISAFAHAFQQALTGDGSSPTVANTLREAGRSDMSATLAISEAEALTGTHRLLTLPGGRHVSVTVPAGTQDGQIIRLEGQVEAESSGDSRGALVLTITIVPPEEQVHEAVADGEATVLSSGSESGTKVAVELAPQELLQEQTRGSASATHAQGAGAIPPPSPATVGTETVQRRRGLSKGRAILLVGLALLLAVGSSVGILYFTRSTQQNPYPPFGTLALDDSLSDNSHGYNWHDSGDRLGTCAFTGGEYHVNALQPGSNHYCIASPNFSDFAYQVQMTIVKGFAGGIIFRDDDTGGNFYLFGIGQDGGYQLDSVNAGNFQILRTRGSGTATNAGLNQSILLAVVAHGSTIEVYVNNKKIDSVNDGSYTQGQIGVFESDLHGNATTAVVFSNAKVWT